MILIEKLVSLKPIRNSLANVIWICIGLENNMEPQYTMKCGEWNIQCDQIYSYFIPKPSSYILIYRDTVVPVCFGGIWWHPGCKLCRKPGWNSSKDSDRELYHQTTHPPHTIPTVLYISTSMIPTYFNPFPPFFWTTCFKHWAERP